MANVTPAGETLKLFLEIRNKAKIPKNNPLQELRFKILTIPIVDKDMEKPRFFGHCW